MAVTRLALFFFGEKTSSVSITTRRYGGADDGRTPSQRYEWYVDYTFVDKNGDSHYGHPSRRGSDMSANVRDKSVYYFEFAPFFNALEKEAEPGVAQPLFIVLGVFLIWVMNKKQKKRGVARSKDPSELTDYDDSVEEAFHNER
jgi:hypothetical protein